jgi:hypothetical protein
MEAREAGYSQGDTGAIDSGVGEHRLEISMGLTRYRDVRMILDLAGNLESPALEEQMAAAAEEDRVETELDMAAVDVGYRQEAAAVEEEEGDGRHGHCKAKALDSTPGQEVA